MGDAPSLNFSDEIVRESFFSLVNSINHIDFAKSFCFPGYFQVDILGLPLEFINF